MMKVVCSWLFLVIAALVISNNCFVAEAVDSDKRDTKQFQQFRNKKIQHNSPFKISESSAKKSHLHKHDHHHHQHQQQQNENPIYVNQPFYESDDHKNGHKKSRKNKRGNKNSMELGDTPWSWSGSSWSYSWDSSGGSSSSSSSSEPPTGTPMPPPPPAPTNAPSTPSPPTSAPPTSVPPTPAPATPSPPTAAPSGGSSSSHSSHSSHSSSSSADGNTHLFTIFNNCTNPIWVAILGNPGFSSIMNGGFVMAEAGPPVVVAVPFGWQGRMWARLGCHFNSTGTCNPPYVPCCASGSCLQADGTFGLYCADSGISPTSLIEMSLDNDSPFGPYDDYDVSLVDGWSVPLSINPVAGSFNPLPDPGVLTPWCQFSGCYASPDCPPSLSIQNTSLSCYSPCQAAVLNGSDTHHEIDRACCVCTQSHPQCDCASSNSQGQYYGCCQGSFGCTPYHVPSYPKDEVCNPWSTDSNRGWNADQLNYINEVESACNKVYSWQFDDKAASFQCRKTDGVVDYDVIFVTRFRSDAPPGVEDARRREFRRELEEKERKIKELVALRDGGKVN